MKNRIPFLIVLGLSLLVMGCEEGSSSFASQSSDPPVSLDMPNASGEFSSGSSSSQAGNGSAGTGEAGTAGGAEGSRETGVQVPETDASSTAILDVSSTASGEDTSSSTAGPADTAGRSQLSDAQQALIPAEDTTSSGPLEPSQDTSSSSSQDTSSSSFEDTSSSSFEDTTSDPGSPGNDGASTPDISTQPEPELVICGPDEFQCNDGDCIDGDYVCDSDEDCSGGEDEFNCPEQPEPSVDTFVSPGSADISESGPDEDAFSGTIECAEGNILCPGGGANMYDDGPCINPDWICDGDTDCSDGSDEAGCGGPG